MGGETVTEPRYAVAVLIAYSASFSVGTAIGFASPAEGEIVEHFPHIDYSLFASLITLGALFGSLLAGYLVERCGRAGTILISTLFFTGGWVLILLRQHIEMLYLARFLLGISSGVNSMVVPIYISEVTPAERRGIFCTGHQFSVVLGILAIYVFGKKGWLSNTPLAFVSFLPVVITATTMVFMPESPAWLVQHNSPDWMVRRAVHYLFGQTTFADTQIEILLETKKKRREDLSISDFKTPAILRPLLIAVVLAGTQQASGINAVLFYTSEIFSSASESLDPSVQSIIVGAVQVVFTFPAAILIDSVGRRALLLTSSVISLIGMSMLIVFYILQGSNNSLVGQLGWLPATSLSIFVAGFSLGLGPIPWLMMSELLPVRARGVGVGLSVAFNSACAFAVTKCFPGLERTIGPAWAFSIFAVVIVFSIFFVYFFVPETKNKTLEEIAAMFKSGTQCEFDKEGLEEASATVMYEIGSHHVTK